MKRTPLFIALCLLSLATMAQRGRWEHIDTAGIVSRDTIKKKAYSLVFINKDSAFSAVTKQRMIDTYFTVYPKEAKRFNKKTLPLVTIIIDPGYKGVAAAGNGVIRVSPKWMTDHPEDIDVVTHEVMHIVQSYPGGAGPGWLTEGIADYVRYTFGVNNDAGKWSLPKFDTSQSYTNAYRVTARFLVWIEKNNKKKQVVNKLDNALRTKTYKPEIWTELTGKTLDELWGEYAKDPVI
jgi:hypothetical protein